MQSLMDISLSALGAFGTGMNVAANNIANINTPNYKAGKAHYATGPGGFGAVVGDITRDNSPGPITPEYIDSYGYAPVEASNVSLEREIVGLISTEYAYTANAKVVQTYEDVAGTILDLKV